MSKQRAPVQETVGPVPGPAVGPLALYGAMFPQTWPTSNEEAQRRLAEHKKGERGGEPLQVMQQNAFAPGAYLEAGLDPDDPTSKPRDACWPLRINLLGDMLHKSSGPEAENPAIVALQEMDVGTSRPLEKTVSGDAANDLPESAVHDMNLDLLSATSGVSKDQIEVSSSQQDMGTSDAGEPDTNELRTYKAPAKDGGETTMIWGEALNRADNVAEKGNPLKNKGKMGNSLLLPKGYELLGDDLGEQLAGYDGPKILPLSRGEEAQEERTALFAEVRTPEGNVISVSSAHLGVKGADRRASHAGFNAAQQRWREGHNSPLIAMQDTNSRPYYTDAPQPDPSSFSNENWRPKTDDEKLEFMELIEKGPLQAPSGLNDVDTLLGVRGGYTDDEIQREKEDESTEKSKSRNRNLKDPRSYENRMSFDSHTAIDRTFVDPVFDVLDTKITKSDKDKNGKNDASDHNSRSTSLLVPENPQRSITPSSVWDWFGKRQDG